MKKIVGVILISIVTYSSTSAQKITTYVAGHLGIATAKSTSTSGNLRFSSGIGAELSLALAKKVNIVARPTINFRGYNNSSFNLKATYFDIPLNIEINYFNVEDLSVYFGFGVYGGLALTGKYKNSGASDWIKLKFGETTADNRSTTDFGLNFTSGLYFNKVKMGIQYQSGLKNVVPKDRQTNGAEIKLRNFSAYLAVKLSAFTGKK